MDVTQAFCNNMAAQYDKLFKDLEATTHKSKI